MTFSQKTKLFFSAVWGFIVSFALIASDVFEYVCEFFSNCVDWIEDVFSKHGKVILGVGAAVVVVACGVGLWIFKWHITWTVWQWIIGVIAGIAVLILLSFCYRDFLLWDTVANMAIFLVVALLNGVALFFLKENYEIIFGCISFCEVLAGAFISVDRCRGEISFESDRADLRGEPKIKECIIQITITVLVLVGLIVGLVLV